MVLCNKASRRRVVVFLGGGGCNDRRFKGVSGYPRWGVGEVVDPSRLNDLSAPKRGYLHDNHAAAHGCWPRDVKMAI